MGSSPTFPVSIPLPIPAPLRSDRDRAPGPRLLITGGSPFTGVRTIDRNRQFPSAWRCMIWTAEVLHRKRSASAGVGAAIVTPRDRGRSKVQCSRLLGDCNRHRRRELLVGLFVGIEGSSSRKSPTLTPTAAIPARPSRFSRSGRPRSISVGAGPDASLFRAVVLDAHEGPAERHWLFPLDTEGDARPAGGALEIIHT